jgi:hypothetical protein
MIYRPSKELTLVVYEDQSSPKCFKMKKGQVSIALVALSLFFIICFITILLGAVYFKDVSEQIKKYNPKLVEMLREEKATLLEENTISTQLNQELTNKLSLSKVEVNTVLPVFKATAGYQDLTAKSFAQIESIESDIKENEIIFRFNIVNGQAGDKKLSGHIFILMKSKGQVNIYPQFSEDPSEGLSEYTNGETFTVSRFRPVEASFMRPKDNKDNLYFQVILFNRAGDLILKKKVGPIRNMLTVN